MEVLGVKRDAASRCLINVFHSLSRVALKISEKHFLSQFSFSFPTALVSEDRDKA